MAFKMKGAPMHDLSSKHGTNANYKKSGAPGLLGKILDPLGLKNKLMGGNKSNCPPQQQQVIGGPKPVEPVTPNAVSNATTTNAPGMTENIDTTAQSAAGGATMKEGLKNGALMKEDKNKNREHMVRGGTLKNPFYKHKGEKREPMEPAKPHKIEHGEIKTKYLGGLRATNKKKGALMKTDPMKRAVKKERELYAEDNRRKRKGTIKGKIINTIEKGVDKVKRKFGASDTTLKTAAATGVKGMGVGGAGKKAMGKMTRKLTKK